MTSDPTDAKDSPSPGAVHRSVLCREVVEGLAPKPGSTLVDGTVGAGGHARALAALVGPGGRVIGLDRDPEMLALASPVTIGQGLPVTLVHADYAEMAEALAELDIAAGSVDGVVLDLGLSSDQLAWRHRGFSFSADGPLDMRFDPGSEDPTAAELVNSLDEVELAKIIYEYGEERHSRRVARRIVEARKAQPFTTTGRLAEVVRRAIPGKWGQIDPATRTFQGLRIAVNDELSRLESTLKALPEALRPGGRVAIISFHSLEDRRVKHAFRDDPRLHVLTRKPITATPEELAVNPRARSAKLRVAERCLTQDGLTEPPNIRSKRGKTQGKAS